MSQPSLRRSLPPIIGCLLAVSSILVGVAPAAAVDGATFVNGANTHRAAAGVPAVRLDAAADRVAIERANQMASANALEHDLAYVGSRLKALGVCYQSFGEIIAWNTKGGVSTFVSQWLNSDGHRKIMLSPTYGTAGGSWARASGGRYYAAMIFVDPCSSAATAPSTAGFTDISTSSFRADIAWLVGKGITSGCAPTRYCPTARVTRDQMASFLSRSTGVPSAHADFFWDDNTSAHQGDINRVAEAGIASGCASARYCPRGSVTRGQMASFLSRALGLPPATHDWFRDDNGTMHEGSINRLAEAGVTGGCASGRFCPDAFVTREQMAGFLRRAFGG